MFRFLVALLAGLVGAAVVHIAVVFAMPWLASNNSWGRLARLGPAFEVVRILPQQVPLAGATAADRHEFAFVDPAFVTASCRFELGDGPVHISSDGTAGFWSASIYTRRGDNLYSINDRSSVGGTFDLVVGSAEQLTDTKATSPNPDETMIPVEFTQAEGYVTIRALVDDESVRPQVEDFVRRMRCVAEGDLPLAQNVTGR